MNSDHTTKRQREIGELFLEGQGWGFGGSVEVAAIDPRRSHPPSEIERITPLCSAA